MVVAVRAESSLESVVAIAVDIRTTRATVMCCVVVVVAIWSQIAIDTVTIAVTIKAVIASKGRPVELVTINGIVAGVITTRTFLRIKSRMPVTVDIDTFVGRAIGIKPRRYGRSATTACAKNGHDGQQQNRYNSLQFHFIAP
jgi:hypothetical protein